MTVSLVHADDAGLNPAVNQAILKLANEGRLASLSIISNAKHTAYFCEEFLKILPKMRNKPAIFLHFNLVEGQPLTVWPGGSKNVDSSGEFYYGYGKFVMSILQDTINPKTIRYELEAQFKTLHSLGIKISGIDSHQHMHALAPIAGVVDDFCKQNNLSIIRSYDDMACQTTVGKIKKILFGILAVCTQVKYHKQLKLPSSWHGHTWRKFVMASWEKVDYKKLETDEIIACHPGSIFDRGFKP